MKTFVAWGGLAVSAYICYVTSPVDWIWWAGFAGTILGFIWTSRDPDVP